MKFLAALIPALSSLASSLIAKVLVALGITLVSYKGINNLLSDFKNQIISNVTGAPQDALQIFYLAGGGKALNIVLGGLTFYVAMVGVTRLTSMGKK